MPRHPGSASGQGVQPAGWRRWLGALPRPCVVCHQWDADSLCGDCRRRFVDITTARCIRCALPVPRSQEASPLCGSCLRHPPPFSHCCTLADYGFPWDRLISRFKFQQQPELGALLSEALHGALCRRPDLPAPHWVLPVPLGPARLAARGYNQAWELARRVAALQARPAQSGWLQRLHDTPHQVGLGRRARAANLRDVMWVPPEGRRAIAGCRLALVDDVMTTGVTATAATQALLAAGAAEVQVWVLARTPPPDDSGAG